MFVYRLFTKKFYCNLIFTKYFISNAIQKMYDVNIFSLCKLLRRKQLNLACRLNDFVSPATATRLLR